MLRMLKNITLLKKQAFLMGLGMMAAGFAAGFVVLYLIMLLMKAETIIALGTFLAMMVFLGISVFINVLQFLQNFKLAITFGKSRKSFVTAYVMVEMVMNMIMLLLIKLFYYVEVLIIRKVFGKIPLEIDISPGLKFYLLLVYAVAIIVIEIFAGTMILKYGRRAVIVLWLIWMAGCLLPGWIVDLVKEKDTSAIGLAGSKIISFCAGIHTMEWILIGCIAVVVLSTITIRCIRTTQVNL